MTSFQSGQRIDKLSHLPGLLFLLSGHLTITIRTEQDKTMCVQRLCPGDSLVFASEAVSQLTPPGLEVIATEDSRLIIMQATYYDIVAHESQYLSAYTYHCASISLAQITQALYQALCLRLDQRIALLLIAYTQYRGTRDLVLTHGQIAEQLGSSREAVSRGLEKLEKTGAIELGRGGVGVRDVRTLRKLAADRR